MSADLLLRWGALLLLSVQEIYWAVTERQAHRAKPKSVPKSRQTQLTRFVLGLFVFFMMLQLIGKIHFAEFPPNIRVQATGLSLVFISFCLLISSRRALGDNWSHAVEYQIKADQELITTGLYSHIRHPIYTGLAIGIIGIELVVHSYLVLFLIPAMAFASYHQARREEKLLIEQFGHQYRDYMTHTAMFIPGLW